MKDISKVLMKNVIFFTIVFTLFYFYFVQSHISHMFLYLNDLNSITEYLYMFMYISFDFMMGIKK